MTAFDFYCLTAAEFVLKARGHRNKHIRSWEPTREICHIIAQVNSKDLLPPPKIWWPLPTDKDKSGMMDPAQLKSIWDKAKDRHGKGTKGQD